MDSNLLKKDSELPLCNDDQAFETTVSKYPSSFDLKVMILTKTKAESVRDKLMMKPANCFVVAEEELQVNNLISFLCFKLDNIDTAFDYNAKVLKKDKKNGIALANRVRFNRYQLNFYDADQDLKLLESLYDVDNALVTVRALAEGELAQSYVRFGPKFHDLAILKYEKLLEGNPQVSDDVLILWKYDYCRCLRRTLHLFNRPEYPDRNLIKTFKTAVDTLIEITDTSHIKVYTARAWTELGQLVYNIKTRPATFARDILEYIPEQRRCMSSKAYFDRALELGYGDFDVMETCAKFYRYCYKFKKSVRLLEEILPLHQTSFVCHHLALSLLKNEEHNLKMRLKNGKRRKQKTSDLMVSEGKPVKTPFQIEESNMKKILKCSRAVLPLALNDQTRQILLHLENAVRLDPYNYNAEYDKGLVLRQLSHTEDAKRVFCALLMKLEIGEVKISCFEQAGYCLLDMAKLKPLDSEKYNFDAINYFQRAIEIAAVLAVKVKYTSLDVRALIPTVKDMLTTPELLVMHDNQLQRLQNLLIKFGKLLPVTTAFTSDSVKNTHDLLEKCLREGKRHDAALLCILGEIASEENEGRFAEHLNVILTSASVSLSNGEYEPASTRFQICFGLLKFHPRRENVKYDVFLMTDEEPANLKSMQMVSHWLTKYCCLKVINSDSHCFKGKQTLKALIHFSQISTSVLVVLKEPKLDYMVEYFTTTIISMEPSNRPKLVILSEKSFEIPLEWLIIPKVLLPQEKAEHSDSDISAWISSLIESIIHTNKNMLQ